MHIHSMPSAIAKTYKSLHTISSQVARRLAAAFSSEGLGIDQGCC